MMGSPEETGGVTLGHAEILGPGAGVSCLGLQTSLQAQAPGSVAWRDPECV